MPDREHLFSGRRATLLGEVGTNLFDAPDRATLIKLTFFANEGRRRAGENPDVIVGGLLTDHGSNYSGDATEFSVKNKVHGLAIGPGDFEGKLPHRFNRDVNEARLLSGRNKGQFCFGHGRKDIHEQVWRETVCHIGGKIEMILPDLPVFGMRGYLAGECVDQDIHRFGKGGTTLNVMVRDEPEYTVLSEHRCVVINGAIAKAKDET